MNRIFLFIALSCLTTTQRSALGQEVGIPLSEQARMQLSQTKDSADALRKKVDQDKEKAEFYYYVRGEKIVLRKSEDYAMVALQPKAEPEAIGTMYEEMTPGVYLVPIAPLPGFAAFDPKQVADNPDKFKYILPIFLYKEDVVGILPEISVKFEPNVDANAYAARFGLKLKAPPEADGSATLILEKGPVTAERLFEALHKLSKQGKKDRSVKWAEPNLLKIFKKQEMEID